jgi:hypothetical protein
VAYAYLYPFGFLKETQLIGRGLSNNPIYDSEKSGPVVAEDDPARKPFSNHALCITKGGGGMVLDACAGPHTGAETEKQYLENAIDPRHPNVPNYTPGTVNNIHCGKGVVIIDLTVAPKKLPALPFTKAFMKKLHISVNRFSKRCNKYVVFSWPDPTRCPSLADQPRSLFYPGITHGQGEVIKTWKLKQEDNGESIRIMSIYSAGLKHPLCTGSSSWVPPVQPRNFYMERVIPGWGNIRPNPLRRVLTGGISGYIII